MGVGKNYLHLIQEKPDEYVQRRELNLGGIRVMLPGTHRVWKKCKKPKNEYS